MLTARLSLTLTYFILPCHRSHSEGPSNSIHCPHKAYVSSCWSANTSASGYKDPWKNVTYEFTLPSPAMSSHLVCLGWFLRWEVSGCVAAVLQLVQWFDQKFIKTNYIPAKIDNSNYKYSLCGDTGETDNHTISKGNKLEQKKHKSGQTC